MSTQKAMAIFLRDSPRSVLFHDMYAPGLPWRRKPVRGVDPGEVADPVPLRDLIDKAGIEDAEIIRFIGTLTYRSPLTAKMQERQCYLVCIANPLPDALHQVADKAYKPRWISAEQVDENDERIRALLTKDLIPELYE